MISGSFTALVTPFKGAAVDYEGLSRLVEFQMQNRITGILAAGTTGESPSLTWDEHIKIIETISIQTRNGCMCIAGTGSNNTSEALEATRHAAELGVDAALLVDPYYNGPSSLEIRKEYVEPVAKACPDIQIIPYVIPGRTGTQLLPEDLAILNRDFDNVCTVKEATASIDNMKRTRVCCGPDYSILSGDDALTFEMMTNPDIKAAGVISVVSNIVPGTIADMVGLLQNGQRAEAENLMRNIEPLFNLVTVTTKEQTPFGDVSCKARNPLAIKTLMQILGLPSGTCRQPVGLMTKNGLNKVLEAAWKVQKENPESFGPAADFFDVDIEERLSRSSFLEGLCYEDY